MSHISYLLNLKAISKRGTLEAKPITFLPFDRNNILVNRNHIFEAIDQRLTLQSQSRSIALWGLGGCGYVQNPTYYCPFLIYISLAKHRLLSNMPIGVGI